MVLGRKSMTNLNNRLESRDTTLLTRVGMAKAMIFPVVMHSCESWTIEKAERRRIDAFKLRCWRKLLRVPWIVKRSNQSILREINPEYSGRTDAGAETPVFWSSDVNRLTHWKSP